MISVEKSLICKHIIVFAHRFPYRVLKTARKVLSVALCSTLLISGTAVSNLSASEKFAHSDAKATETATTINVPRSMGLITDRWEPEDGSRTGFTVVHIQDAHCNYDAQLSVADILSYLKENYGITHVNVEGGCGKYDTSIFDHLASFEAREKAADILVKRGTLNGAEYAGITDKEFFLWGVEDPVLYRKNLMAYMNARKYRDEVFSSLAKLRTYLEKAKKLVFTQKLLDLDRKIQLYRNEKKELRDHLSHLVSAAEESGIDLSGYPNVLTLAITMADEEIIDFKQANLERSALMTRLYGHLPREDLTELESLALFFRQGSISAADFYIYLSNRAKLMDPSLENFPQLSKYITYAARYADINEIAIMDEMTALEETVADIFADNDIQRELLFFCKGLRMIEGILSAAITPQEYAFYKENSSALSFHNAKKLLKDILHTHGIFKNSDIDALKTDELIRKAASFYEYSLERDEAFIRNLRFPYDTGTAALVTGGFHTKNLNRIFRREGIAYITVMPFFRNSEGYNSPYFEILEGRELPISGGMFPLVYSLQIPSRLAPIAGVIDSSNLEMFEVSAYIAGEVASGVSLVVTPENASPIHFGEGHENVRHMTVRELLYETHEKYIDRRISRGEFFEVTDDEMDAAIGTALQISDSPEIHAQIINLQLGKNLAGDPIGIKRSTGLLETRRKEHAGGRGVSIRSDISGSEALNAMVHGIIAGFAQNHETVSRITELLINGDLYEARRLFESADKHRIALWEMSAEHRKNIPRDYAEGFASIARIMRNNHLKMSQNGSWYESEELANFRDLWRENNQIAQGIKLHIDATDDEGNMIPELLEQAIQKLNEKGLPYKIANLAQQKIVTANEQYTYDQEGKSFVIWLVESDGQPIQDQNKIDEILRDLEHFLRVNRWFKMQTNFSEDGTTSDQLYKIPNTVASGRLGYRFGAYNSGIIVIPNETGLARIQPDDHHKHVPKYVPYTGLYGRKPSKPLPYRIAQKMSLRPLRQQVTELKPFLKLLTQRSLRDLAISDDTNFRTGIRGRAAHRIFGVTLDLREQEPEETKKIHKDDIFDIDMPLRKKSAERKKQIPAWVIKFGEFPDDTTAISNWIKEWVISGYARKKGITSVCPHDPVGFLEAIGHEKQGEKLNKAWKEKDFETINNIINAFFTVKDKGLFTSSPTVQGGFTLSKILHVLYPDLHDAPHVATSEELARLDAELEKIKQDLDEVFSGKSEEEKKKILSSWSDKMRETVRKLHAAGVTHRDLKPDNILVDIKNNEVYIIDFETAVLTEKFQDKLLIPDIIRAATPGYSHFYQMNKDMYTALRSLDDRDLFTYLKAQDKFSLEVIYDELVHGFQPFSTRAWMWFSTKGMGHRMIKNGRDLALVKNMVKLARAHQTEDYTPLVEETSEEYNNIIHKFMANLHETFDRRENFEVVRKTFEEKEPLLEKKIKHLENMIKKTEKVLVSIRDDQSETFKKLRTLREAKRTRGLKSSESRTSSIDMTASSLDINLEVAEAKLEDFTKQEEHTKRELNKYIEELEENRAALTELLAKKEKAEKELKKAEELQDYWRHKSDDISRFLELVQQLAAEKPEPIPEAIPVEEEDSKSFATSWIGGDNFTGTPASVLSGDLGRYIEKAGEVASSIISGGVGLKELNFRINRDGKAEPIREDISINGRGIKMSRLRGAGDIASVSPDGKRISINWTAVNEILAISDMTDPSERVEAMKKLIRQTGLPTEPDPAVYAAFIEASAAPLSNEERYAITGRILLHEIASAYSLQVQHEEIARGERELIDSAEAHITGMIAEIHAGNTTRIRRYMGPMLSARDLFQRTSAEDFPETAAIRGPAPRVSAKGTVMVEQGVEKHGKDLANPAEKLLSFEAGARQTIKSCYQDIFFGEKSHIFVIGATPSLEDGTTAHELTLASPVSRSSSALRNMVERWNLSENTALTQSIGTRKARASILGIAAAAAEGAEQHRIQCSISSTVLAELDTDSSLLEQINRMLGTDFDSVTSFLSETAMVDVINDLLERGEGISPAVLAMPFNEAALHGIARLNLSKVISHSRHDTLTRANRDYFRAVSTVAQTIAMISDRSDVQAIADSLLELAEKDPVKFFLSRRFEIFLPPVLPRDHNKIREDYMAKAAILRSL